MNLKEILFIKSTGGSSEPPVEKTITGNPATFTTRFKKALTSLVAPMSFTQSGSGDPSRANERPIIGFTGLTADRNGTTYSVVFPDNKTIYGGSFDFATGVLTVSMFGVTKKLSECSSKSVSGDMTQYVFNNITDLSIVNNSSQVCSIAKYAWNGFERTYDHFYAYTASTTDKTRLLLFVDNRSIDESKEVTAVFPLSAPYTVQLEPVSIVTVKGSNTVSVANVGTLTVKYLD